MHNTTVIDLLDHGFVELIEQSGGDSRITDAARTSYLTGKTIRDDEKLLRYLIKHQHTGPLEFVRFTFRIRAPLFVFNQIIRHRTASTNCMSLRFSEALDMVYIPKLEDLREQDMVNKQGSSNPLPIDDAGKAQEILIAACENARIAYENLISLGLSRETARFVLPQNQYTQWYWAMDLNNLFKFLKLRLDKHAQFETRLYAQAISQFVKEGCPVAYKAFEDFILNV